MPKISQYADGGTPQNSDKFVIARSGRNYSVLGSAIKTFIQALTDTIYVALTGNQTVAGIKSFSSFPVTPSSAPTTDYQVANKKYVDDTIVVLSAVRVYTTDDTWNKPAGLHHVIVELWGGGGGGGGVTGVAGQAAGGGGGGGGGYAKERLAAATLGASEAVTVGAVGGGGAAGNNAGTAGGTASFGTHLQATGGAAGGGQAASATVPRKAANAGAGGAGSGGDINMTGLYGALGYIMSTTDGASSGGGAGGGGGGSGGRQATVSTAGLAGTAPGGGGGGGCSLNDANNRAGGDGAVGWVIVWEYV